jgi:hypothetical protein
MSLPRTTNRTSGFPIGSRVSDGHRRSMHGAKPYRRRPPNPRIGPAAASPRLASGRGILERVCLTQNQISLARINGER